MIAIQEAAARFPRRAVDAHKGDCGRLLVLAGSVGYTGAAYLTAQAAALSGCGLVTVAAGKTIHPILASKFTEVMVRPFIETRDGSLSLMAEKELSALADASDALAIGPGISRNRETAELVRALVMKVERPIVLDADAIGAFEGHLDSMKRSKAKMVLTPHPGEFARLTGKDVQTVQSNRKELALAFANEYNTVLILKGHATVVAAPGGHWYVNDTGNSGMATGGTGDVLTGIVAGFIAQGAQPTDAAALAVYHHGRAGDRAAEERGVLGMLATDILRALPDTLKALA